MKIFLFLLVLFGSLLPRTSSNIDKSQIVSFRANTKTQMVKMYWKNSQGENFGSLGGLKKHLENNDEILHLAMNGGMYLKDRSPQGLFVENGILKKKTNRVKNAYGNFYLQPNGIFSINKSGKARVLKTQDFKLTEDINYATQSGPMLVIDGEIHDRFTKGSKNINIRNGVGILENGEILFAMSKEKVNLYDFANYFLSRGCKNALYLDGFVSKTYCPSEEWKDLDGNFGVIIGVSEKKK